MISFVLLNWNGRGFLHRCIESLTAQTDDRWELIVVDNGSTNGSLEYLADVAKRGIAEQLIRLPENRGFAVGMNAGIAACSGDLIVPLNSDVFLGRNFVEALHAMPRQPGIGMWSVPTYHWEWSEDGRDELTDRLEMVGVAMVRRLSVCAWHPEVDRPETLFGPQGCAPVFSRHALAAAVRSSGHVFDERYVSYGEDIDLYMRLQSLGVRCGTCLATGIWHIGSASSGGGIKLEDKPIDIQKLVVKNRWRNYHKIGGTHKALTVLPWMLWDDLLRIANVTTRRISPRILNSYRDAWMQRKEKRYQPFPIPFAGGVFSRSAWFAQRRGALPPLGSPHPPREVMLGKAA